ncbi:MAG: SDR family NAD(P)-dependent oxidoreductase [Trebonia sp.]
MNIEGQIALITGSNRGIGRRFVEELLERGAAKVYATARRPELVSITGVETLPLDITDPASVAAAAKKAQDVTLLINNAGIATRTRSVGSVMDLLGRRELLRGREVRGVEPYERHPPGTRTAGHPS